VPGAGTTDSWEALLQPYYRDERVEIFHGDALTVLWALDELIDVVIADPPYCSGGRTSAERTTKSTSTKYRSSDAKGPMLEFSGDTRDQRSYAHWSALWLTAALRLTRPGGVAFTWSDWRQLAATSDALQAGGWTWRGIVTWDKTNASRPVRGRFRLDTEFAVWGSSGALPVHADVYPSSIVTAMAPRRRQHIAQKPEGVYAHLLSVAPPQSLVLDPFTGTGTALVAAAAAGHRAIGIELDERYCEIAAERVAEAWRNG
jgi:site-specific DNA-methyltransferase (adenine-specific)